jgi:thiosulfate reductase cytochrome b subunit
MAETAYLPGVTIQNTEVLDAPRHSALVRVTHWVHALSFFGLFISGIAILLAHPRLYWGETGAVGGPSLIDLPLPFVLNIPIRGPGRYLHFLSAWVCVLNGLLYVISGFFTRHFARNLVPAKGEFNWSTITRILGSHARLKRPGEAEARTYNVVQRLSYLGVIFVLFPLVIWTGLGMSPAVVSVIPAMATTWGGQQSARTIHFFVSSLLVVFLVVHIAMVWLAGFKKRMRAMITGRSASRKETP